ncbi:type IV pilin-like G/H family protein [Cylindrospermum sp. FACHB-282]|uniref:type IV pilin-like G/H family protein n=1 Tax=Cylindrospermum sp. FACHB-282 TaxID=2692794 RepID=UPI0016859B5D|nr:type IV pilin-like G/H family protein [Cylindrospermum sp. FACHB-282]MBD2384961.1 type IV pilin-like G/H family protein [Cylindrospermum sp. FACHB-282]
MTNRFLSHLLQKNAHQGFTAWDFLLLIFMVGILGAIAFPSLISSKTTLVSAEGKQYIGAMNRSQQANFLEYRNFASSIKDLRLGIKTQTPNYNYSTRVTDKAAYNYAIARRKYVSGELFERRTVKTYVGAVFVVPTPKNSQNSQDEPSTIAIICQANSLTTSRPADPIYQNGVMSCGDGTSSLP